MIAALFDIVNAASNLARDATQWARCTASQTQRRQKKRLSGSEEFGREIESRAPCLGLYLLQSAESASSYR
jgi:hypothetical protein